MKELEFTVRLQFSHDIMQDEIEGVAGRLLYALDDFVHSVGIAPEDSEALTDAIYIERAGTKTITRTYNNH